MAGKLTSLRARFERRYFTLTPSHVALFLLNWLFIGFTLGTILLLGPVRWINAALEGNPDSEFVERIAVIAIIVILVVASFWISLILARIELRSRRVVTALTLAAVLLAGFMTYGLWVTPRLMTPAMSEVEEVSPNFTFGPYPSEEKIEELKAEGYDAIVSLLHPAVVPFEPQLIAREREAVERIGMEFIHIPMLPWISGNEGAIREIQAIASTRTGRYYVHCYLGRDRISLFRRVINALPDRNSARKWQMGRTMARGESVKLDEAVILIPYPTAGEFNSIIFSEVRNVVALLDPNDPDDKARIEEAREVLTKGGVGLTVIPVGERSYSPEAILASVETVEKLERPVLVHSFHAVASGKAPIAEAFLQAWRTRRAPLPPSLFAESMTNGQPRVVSPGVAVGPQPTGPEFGAYLARRGVRTVLRVGPVTLADEARMASDIEATNESGQKWLAIDGDPRYWDDLIKDDGPVYIYGPRSEEVAEIIAGVYGPPLPTATLRRN